MMKSARARESLTTVLAALAVIAGGGASAWGWGTPEHEAYGKRAFSLARAKATSLTGWTIATPEDIVGTFSGEADFCHSFWHAPSTKVTPNGAGGTLRPIDPHNPPPDCDIFQGMSGQQVPTPLGLSILKQTMQDNAYLLATNTNHFGQINTRRHYQAFHMLAIEAARRAWKLRADGSTAGKATSAICQSMALGLQGFSMHYLQDRAATGHAWNHDSRNYDWNNYGIGSEGMRMAGLRGCFHDQPLKNRTAFIVANDFNCVDPVRFALDGRIRQGLGAQPRNMGGEFFDPTWNAASGWMTDGADPDTIPDLQAVQVHDDPAISSMLEIWQTYATGITPTAVPWKPTFVSNFEMCTVAASICCQKPFEMTASHCDYCEPDITEAEMASLCLDPSFTATESEPADAAQQYSAFVQTQTVDGDEAFLSTRMWARLKDVRTSAWASATSVAETIAASSTAATPHDDGFSPDARWDLTSNILALAGCPGPVTCADYAAELHWTDLVTVGFGAGSYACPAAGGATAAAEFIDTDGNMCCHAVQ